MNSNLNDKRPIGLFDSGLGGLTVLRSLRHTLPAEDLLYLGDTARTPYGSKTRETIVRYARECSQFLLREEVKLLVVACNTVTACCLEELAATLPVPVVGTITPVIRALQMLNTDRPIAVIGTQATIASGAYEKQIHQCIPGAEILSIACPLFVPLVEQGICEGEIVDKVIELYLKPLRARRPAALILGCTHYPLLRDAITSYIGAETIVIESSTAIASDIRELLEREKMMRAGQSSGAERYIVTDDSGRFNHLASLFLDTGEITAVQIESLVG